MKKLIIGLFAVMICLSGFAVADSPWSQFSVKGDDGGWNDPHLSEGFLYGDGLYEPLNEISIGGFAPEISNL